MRENITKKREKKGAYVYNNPIKKKVTPINQWVVLH